MRTPEEARRFLRPSPEDLHDPLAMKGMEEAAEILGVAAASRRRIVVFGAGHVAQSLVRCLLEMECQVLCIDPRPDWLAKLPASGKLITVQADDMPVEVARVRDDDFVVCVTMGHRTDRPILEAIFRQGRQPAYLGVIGSNATAAHSAGQIDVGRVTMRTFLLSGALAGLAGAIEVTGVTYSLYENLSPGYGYTAIAVALVGALDPALTVLSGVLFGALEAGASAMQRDAGIPSVLASVVEASIILLLLGVGALRGRTRLWIQSRWLQRPQPSASAAEAP